MKAALIGAGQIAHQHLACLSSSPGIALAGVCDLSRALAESAAEQYGAGAWFTDHRAMLREARPDVVHITTPPGSHFRLAMDALAAGAHVIVEKPITPVRDELDALLGSAAERGRIVVEDYNYLFNEPVRRIAELARSGDLGEVVDVEVRINTDILDPGHAFSDPNVPHPTLALPGGPIADFLPHLASMAHCFVGPHRSARSRWWKRTAGSPLPYDEFRALVVAERGTAALSFSAGTRPEMFWIRVNGTRMRATADLYDMTLVLNRPRGGPRPLARIRDRFAEARDIHRATRRAFLQKFSARSGVYDGLWTLVSRTYEAARSGGEPPISTRQIAEVNDLIAALVAEENRF
jgi:predicted dehydrogenase